MDAEKLRVARDKLTRVFRYLEALNQHRNPAKRQMREQPWSMALRDFPEHASIQRGTGKVSASKAKDGNSGNAEETSAHFVLKVQRPRLTASPEPPEQIAGWGKDGWGDPFAVISVEETLEGTENCPGRKMC